MSKYVQSTKYLNEIIELHSYVKKYLIICEEISETTFLQPLKEERDAYDHLLIAFSLDWKDTKALSNFKSAKNHEERAFFDVMDFFCITLKEKIANEVNAIIATGKKISEVYPRYADMRELLLSSIKQIADIRYRRDLSENAMDIKTYIDIAEKIFDFYKEIETKANLYK